MAFIISFKNYYCRIIIKNLMKCNILNTFAFKSYGKFANHNIEKLYLWSLAMAMASTIPVLGLKSVCFRKISPLRWRRIFFEPFGLELCVLYYTSGYSGYAVF